MSLNRVKKGMATGLLAAIMAASGCFFGGSIKEGSEKADFFFWMLPPVAGGANITYTSYDNLSCETIREKTRADILSVFGNSSIDVKYYGRNEKYLGSAKIRVSGGFGYSSVVISTYDAYGNEIDTGKLERMPDASDFLKNDEMHRTPEILNPAIKDD
jgi:hypothetical protein